MEQKDRKYYYYLMKKMRIKKKSRVGRNSRFEKSGAKKSFKGELNLEGLELKVFSYAQDEMIP
jgi:hypothetical protein